MPKEHKRMFIRDKSENNFELDIGGDVTQVTVSGGMDMEVTIDKLYGPMIFTDVKVTLDLNTVEWIFWRKDAFTTWKEVARCPGQLTTDFDCEECHENTCKEEFSGEEGDYCSAECKAAHNKSFGK